MRKIHLLFIAITVGSLTSCFNGEKADGYGNFEATEIMVSSEASGKLVFFDVEEGQVLEAGEIVGLVDTTQLYLSKLQALGSKAAVASKSVSVHSQVSVLHQQMQIAITEQQRIQNMFNANASTQRQLDQANSQVDVLRKQIQNIETQNVTILSEERSIAAKVASIEDLIEKSKVANPIQGTVLNKFAEPGEIVSFGKPLFKIADLRQMTLRVYISETQLSSIKIGQEVTVKIDSGKEMKSYTGSVSWVSPAAEFTPKTIQTKEERVNLVYAVKVLVKNDGSLKIGMPAEMWIKE